MIFLADDHTMTVTGVGGTDHLTNDKADLRANDGLFDIVIVASNDASLALQMMQVYPCKRMQV